LSNDAERNNPDTSAIASFVAGLSYERIPGEVIERIKLLMPIPSAAVFDLRPERRCVLMETMLRLDSLPDVGALARGR
jgi:hypothetical protein